MKLSDSNWRKENGKWVRDTYYKGVKLTKTGFKNFDITKHRRGWRNECSLCGKKCYQALGNQYEKICLDCADEWLEKSADEFNFIINRIQERREFIKNNKDNIMDKEKEKVEIWTRQDMLDKLESEE